MRNMLIAEIGSVHDGSFGNALKLVEAASACGADAVKFQTHIAEAETLKDAPMPPYFKGEPRFAYFRRTGFSLDQWRALRAKAQEHRVAFLSSPFSLEAVDLLEEVGVECYKIPSGERSATCRCSRGYRRLASPFLPSSGMSDWRELDAVVETLRPGGPITVLEMQARPIPARPSRSASTCSPRLRQRYDLPVGFSDQTTGPAAAIAAAALGAEPSSRRTSTFLCRCTRQRSPRRHGA